MLQFLWTGTHLGGEWSQRATRARHGRTTRHGRPFRYGQPGRYDRRKEPTLNRLRRKDQERPSQEAVDHRADRTS
jgi:hypothetical protein